jgi:DNA helicase II / ATP-dependent DNA helicase PcrA
VVSGHQWGSTASKPAGPSTFLTELRDAIESAAAAGTPCGTVDVWADSPADGDPNPLRDRVVEAQWPVDPLADRRSLAEQGAALVRSAADGIADEHATEDLHGWAADVDALLAERARAAQPKPPAPLPIHLSVSAMVDLGRDPAAAAARLHRRLPRRPDPQALRGTAFHEWVQRYFQAEKLFDLDDLPGAVDAERQDRGELEELQAAFALSPWAARSPLDVEVPFDMVIGNRIVRGRIDAVFAEGDGTVTVVDWKTGDPPTTPEDLQHNAVQLALYRLAWARLHGCAPESVRAAFHYVRSGLTIVPERLPGLDELTALLADPDEEPAA